MSQLNSTLNPSTTDLPDEIWSEALLVTESTPQPYRTTQILIPESDIAVSAPVDGGRVQLIFRKVSLWLRLHPGYTNSPRQQALEGLPHGR